MPALSWTLSLFLFQFEQGTPMSPPYKSSCWYLVELDNVSVSESIEGKAYSFPLC